MVPRPLSTEPTRGNPRLPPPLLVTGRSLGAVMLAFRIRTHRPDDSPGPQCPAFPRVSHHAPALC